MERFFWICLAGAAGTGARYLIALWAAQRYGSTFPFGTLFVNLIGCFAIAAVMHAALTLSWSPTVRSAIAIGFIGGLTTYSSFNYETHTAHRRGRAGYSRLERRDDHLRRVRVRLARNGLRQATARSVRRASCEYSMASSCWSESS
jgi:CrcB protein